LRLGKACNLGITLGGLNGDGDLDAFAANSTISGLNVVESDKVWLNATPLKLGWKPSIRRSV
jgi:hypothetical protein